MGATVLIADDSMVIRAVLRHHLEEEGYQVVEAVNGPDAIEMMRHHRPDMVLLDIEMPGLNGHEVLRRVKADEELEDTPVVFLTGQTGSEQIVAGLRAGAQDYLKKPFEPAELIARVGAAVRTKRLQDALRERSAELDRMSRTDALTGVFNRRHLDEELGRFVSLADRHADTVAVVMFDIDHFKRINDTYGHEAGDAVLKEFSRRVQTVVRADDILGRWGDSVVGRWGGEEFLLVLPQTGIEGAYVVGERVRSAIAGATFAIGDHQVDITVSGGCAAGTKPPAELVRSADAALYQAKEAGRNRLVAATSPQPLP
ncbi:MAG: two-component system, cell cycle response regulator [Actinomycetota bacterium]|nr:two-component system, cell cycle response regulator [Actinomycetota bacterium]